MLSLCAAESVVLFVAFLTGGLLLEVVVCEALFRVEVEVELCGVNIVTLDEAHYLNVDVVPCFEELEDLLVDSFEVKVLD